MNSVLREFLLVSTATEGTFLHIMVVGGWTLGVGCQVKGDFRRSQVPALPSLAMLKELPSSTRFGLQVELVLASRYPQPSARQVYQNAVFW